MDCKKLADTVWHHALAHIQDQFETDGGFADIYFNGGDCAREKFIKQIFEDYAEAEKERSGRND